jgi:hypothetical protein
MRDRWALLWRKAQVVDVATVLALSTPAVWGGATKDNQTIRPAWMPRDVTAVCFSPSRFFRWKGETPWFHKRVITSLPV